MGEKRQRSEESHSEAEPVVKGEGETPEKRQKVESDELRPLTRENLALLEGKMPPVTPQNKRKNGEGAEETTESKSTRSKVSAKNYTKQEQVLLYNGILLDESKAADVVLDTETGKDILQAAKDLVKDERKSAMKPEEVREWLDERKDQKYSNEATFIDVMWKILVGKTRTMKQPATDALEENQEWIVKEFREHGLRHKKDQAFRSKTVPSKDQKGELELGKYLMKVPDVSTPKPDIAYGLRADAFTPKEGVINLSLGGISDVTEDMVYPFFVIEFKSAKGDLAAAVIQACRGGAALVYSMRRLREKAGLPNDNNITNVGRMAFSLAMSPDKAKIFVHWAQNDTKGKLVYCMARLGVFHPEEEADIPKMRSHINNILDWGILKRKLYIKDMLAKIDERSEASTGATGEN